MEPGARPSCAQFTLELRGVQLGESRRDSTMHAKLVLSLLTVAGLLAAVGVTGLSYGLLTSSTHHLALVKMDFPGWAGTPCLGHGDALNAGLRVDFNSEWVTQDSLVSVLNQLTQKKWYPITRMTTSITLLPIQRTV